MASYTDTQRTFRAILFGCVLLLLSGCAAQAPSGTDDYTQVHDTLADLEKNYEAENADAFMKMVGRDYDLDFTALERSVNDELDDFSGFDIDLIVDRVSVDNDSGLIFAETHWTKRRVSMRTGREFIIDGETVFIFRTLPDGNLMLRGMKGDPIFGGR